MCKACDRKREREKKCCIGCRNGTSTDLPRAQHRLTLNASSRFAVLLKRRKNVPKIDSLLITLIKSEPPSTSNFNDKFIFNSRVQFLVTNIEPGILMFHHGED